MQKKRKAVWNLIFLLIVFALTIYGVFYGEDVGAVIDALKRAEIPLLVPAVGFVIFSIWGESIIIWYMMRSFQIYLKKRICFMFSAVGFFFCCITPAAGGGQPMQVYYMRKEHIPVPVSAVVLMVVTITYKLVLVVIGFAILLAGRGFLHRYLEGILPIYYLGLSLNVFCVCFMTLLVFHPLLAEKIIAAGITLLERMHLLRRSRALRGKFLESMEAYRETAAYLKGHRKVIAVVILITFVQRLALFAVTWMVYLAFGMSGTSMGDVVVLQAVISISVDMLPLPGGMGISEVLFLRIFAPVFQAVTLPAMVLSRGIGYYSQLLFCALFTAGTQIYYAMRQGSDCPALENRST